MNSYYRSVINSLAEDIIKAYDIQVPIQSMEEVVEKMGGKVQTDMIYSEGSVVRDGDRFVITVSPFQDENRKRFTIAHELGHLFLHMGYMTNEELWNDADKNVYHRSGSSEKEYQANEFAAAFLMPQEQYVQILEESTIEGRVNISRIAKYFNVSVNAAANRGRFLGYLKW